MRCPSSFAEILQARVAREGRPPGPPRAGFWDGVAASSWMHATAADLQPGHFSDAPRASQRNGTLGDPWGWQPPRPPRVHRTLDADQRRSLDFFRQLGERQLDSAATADEVHSAYHRLAMKLHPDRVGISAGAGDLAPGRDAFLRLRRHHVVLMAMTGAPQGPLCS